MKSFFTIIDRYISKELLLTCLAVTLVLMLILLSSTLARLLGKAADGSIPSDAVLPLLSITAARYLILLLPLSLYLGVLLSFSRLYKDNEMAAMGACGIGLKRFYRPLMIVVIPVTLLVSFLTLYAMPWIAQKGQLIKAEIESRSELTGLIPGRFNESSDGNAIMFLERQSSDGHHMENVFMHQSLDADRSQVETAARASRYRDEQGRHFILFIDGQHYQGQPGKRDFQIVQYEKHGIYLPESAVPEQSTHRDAMLTRELWQSEHPLHQAELQWRLSIPLATLLLAILALPLSYTTPRKGRYSKLALAILIYLMYSNLLGVGQTWVEQQKVPAMLGIWWVHGFAVLLILFWWMRRAGGFRMLMQRNGAAT
ncbi:MAG: LPS export ABC transporter permease LptF [Gammaproteobacteria bacterium]|nr:MAG: LPS export ABC transporter permease LptF [Gammaproteobacteria bacterium]